MRINQKLEINKAALLLLGLLALASCDTARTKRPPVYGGETISEGLDEKGGSENLPFLIAETSHDEPYGYSADNPVRVGGGGAAGARNQQRYLNALLGPDGQPITYERRGSCCPFKTRRGLVNNDGQLDLYTVTWRGQKAPVVLYLNMYARAD
jgi:hypothetical protein